MSVAVRPAELSRGHEAEELFRSSIGEGPLFPEPMQDYTDVVTDPYLQSISSRDDYIGTEHLREFHFETYAPIRSWEITLGVPQIVFNPTVWFHGRVEKPMDPAELGLIVKPREEVGLPPIPDSSYHNRVDPDLTKISVGDSEAVKLGAVQVGSLIDFRGNLSRGSGYDLSWYYSGIKEYFERLARFLEAKTAPKPTVPEVEAMLESSMRVMDKFATALQDPDSGVQKWTPEFRQSMAQIHIRHGIGCLELLENAHELKKLSHLIQKLDELEGKSCD